MLHDSIAMRLRRAYLSMHRAAAAHFAQHGASVEQYVLLSVLQDQDGLTQRTLSQRMGSDDNTVAAMVRRLEDRRLVKRTTCSEDARARRVWLTGRGRQLQAQLLAGAEPCHHAIEQAVAPLDSEELFACLDRIHEAAAFETSKQRAAS